VRGVGNTILAKPSLCEFRTEVQKLLLLFPPRFFIHDDFDLNPPTSIMLALSSGERLISTLNPNIFIASFNSAIQALRIKMVRSNKKLCVVDNSLMLKEIFFDPAHIAKQYAI
jgi:hypothetical protein